MEENKLIPKPKEKRINPKESLFLKLYTDRNSKTFGNGTLSYQAAFPNSEYNTARATAPLLLAKHSIKFTDLMDAAGLTDGKINEKLVEWVNAKKNKTQPDYPTQLKAGEMIAKMKGHLSRNGDAPNLTQVNVQVNANQFFGEGEE